MLKNTSEDLEFSKQISLVDSRQFSKFEAVELKSQGVLVDVARYREHGPRTTRIPDRLKGIPPLSQPIKQISNTFI